ncbi:MAG TPA: hypothetical protein VMP01_14470 [Pirellulaceae bacterium]|nr:hypothetical protein [Pirellulaceae bacterium]
MVHGFAREGNAVHMLRLMHVATDTQGWDHPDVFSDILAVLTNGAEYARRISKIPILVETPFGVAYRSAPPFAPGAEALRTASTGGIPHVDKVLSVFGELGRGLTMELKPHPGSSTYTVADLASDSIQRMSLSRECEWTLIAYCDYLADGRPWKNCRGETFSPTSIAEHLLSLSAAGGACYGCHRPYALARCVGRERETPGFLSSPAKHACESHLRELSRELERNQRPDGAWDRNSLPSGRADKSGASSSDLPQLEQLLTITGHNLEWMAMVPQDLRPRDKAISMAIEYLLGLLQSRRDDCFHFFWPQTSHALRALVHLSTPVGEPIG